MKTKFNNLQEVNEGNPFKIPENYFARFNEEIMHRLPEKEFVPPRKVSLWEKARPWVYLAAMLAGLYITITFITRPPEEGLFSSRKETPVRTAMDSTTDSYWSTVYITEEEFYQYLEDQLVSDGYYDYLYYQVYQ
ncbi:MAG: hypothetical protein ACOX19_05795 [Fermentimonas sp.]|jgi:hypothetical protein